MLVISEALERDGYSPSESTAEEVIRHLWWKKEHVRGELQNTRQTLKKIMGGEQHKALEVGGRETEGWGLLIPVCVLVHYRLYLGQCMHRFKV